MPKVTIIGMYVTLDEDNVFSKLIIAYFKKTKKKNHIIGIYDIR
jgi:hypothetical protein